MLLRLYVNMYVSCCVFCILWMAMSIALSFALRIFGYPWSLSEIRVLLYGLYTHEPAMLPTIWPSEFLEGGMKDPSMYIHCCGGSKHIWTRSTGILRVYLMWWLSFFLY